MYNKRNLLSGLQTFFVSKNCNEENLYGDWVHHLFLIPVNINNL